jgi:hypothetical protein
MGWSMLCRGFAWVGGGGKDVTHCLSVSINGLM